MKVKDICKIEGVIKASPDETLSSVLSRLSSSHDAAFVFDEKGNFRGVVSPYYSSIKRSYPPRAKAGNCIVHPPKLQCTDNLDRAAGLMMESKIHHLPVFNNREFIGILTARRIIQCLKDKSKLKIKASSVLKTKKPLVTVFMDDPISKAISFYKRHKVSKLVVITPTFKLKGMLAYYDLVEFLSLPKQRLSFGFKSGDRNPILQKKVRNFYKSKVLTIKPSDTLEKAASLIISEEIGSVVPVDYNNHPLGIITTRDILNQLSKKKKGPLIQLIHINLSPPNLKAARNFAQSVANRIARKKGPQKTIIKIEEKKRGGIFEVALQVFTKGKPVKVITKQGKNLFVVLARFGVTISSYLSKRRKKDKN